MAQGGTGHRLHLRAPCALNPGGAGSARLKRPALALGVLADPGRATDRRWTGDVRQVGACRDVHVDIQRGAPSGHASGQEGRAGDVQGRAWDVQKRAGDVQRTCGGRAGDMQGTCRRRAGARMGRAGDVPSKQEDGEEYGGVGGAGEAAVEAGGQEQEQHVQVEEQARPRRRLPRGASDAVALSPS